MRTHLLILTGIVLAVTRGRAAELDDLTKDITAVAGSGWTITKDVSSITLARKDVQLLNPINPPTPGPGRPRQDLERIRTQVRL